MRLTVNLEPELYAVALSLAKAEDCTISAAVNRLLHRSLPGFGTHAPRRSTSPTKRNGFVISRGRRPITADTVRQIEAEDDDDWRQPSLVTWPCKKEGTETRAEP